MDELAVARAELAHLEDNERKLVEQLRGVRVAAAVQRKRINELIRTRGPFIQRLPVELLSSILHLALFEADPSEKAILARVSRHWRDVILDDPNFWTTIDIIGGQSLGGVREQLRRSREAPLDIVIEDESSRAHRTIRKGLDLLVPYANRWRSLSIYTRQVLVPLLPIISRRIGTIKFPSLKRVRLQYVGVDTVPIFFSSTNVPVLEHFEIWNTHQNPPSTPGASFSQYIPALTLVTLSLSGHMPPCSLQPDSIHFPVLETLEISLINPVDFFKAIVTPKLKYLDYVIDSTNSLVTVFGGLGEKFSSVRRVSLSTRPSRPDTLGAVAFCRAFPHVHHAEFYSAGPPSGFFDPCEGTDGSQSPADYWKSLESVVFPQIYPPMWLEPPIREIAFVQWLVTRQDQQPLRVRIEGANIPDEKRNFRT
ncbi:hypothetical protein EDC04DRAFT_739318 [Pisolithus marmoratus]|nr:hypothetical protein EDC04DRAFT_739318 [Pisolithus marmoratus]